MRILVLCAAVAAALAVTTEPARACSCALGDPRSALARADAAFEGVFVERRGETSFVCGQIAPQRLREAARPLPTPDGSGPAMLLVGGQFGPARTIALDRRGRTLGYGRGEGDTLMLSTCPGSRRVVEIVWLERGYALAVRDLRGLRVVRQRPVRLSGSTYPGAIRCEDERGSRVLVFAHNLDFPERSRLLRWSSGRLVTLWRGAALQASLRRRVAYLNAGTRGTQLVALDLGTRRTTRIARIPAFTGPLAASPDGTKLAGVAYSSPVDEARPSRLVLVDRGRVRTTALGSSNVSGDLGPVRVVRRLPSPVTHALATVPR